MKSLLTFCCPFFFLPAFAQDLGERARLNQDSTAWNRELLARDLVNYREYAHWLAVLPHDCTITSAGTVSRKQKMPRRLVETVSSG